MKIYYQISTLNRNLMILSSFSLGIFSLNSLYTISKIKTEPGITKTELFLASALVLPAVMSYNAANKVQLIGRIGSDVIIKSLTTKTYKKHEISILGNELRVGKARFLLDSNGFLNKNEFLKFLNK